MLYILKDHTLYAKSSKYEFWLKSGTFLGHMASKDGIMLDSTKIKAIHGWPRPASVSEV